MSLHLLKIYKHVMPSQRNVSTQKLPVNKRTETLAFTVCKLKFCGKERVLKSHSRNIHFSHGQQLTKRKKSNIPPQNKNKPKRKCRKVVSRRHSLWTMKNTTTKNNLGLFLEFAFSKHCFLLLSLLPLFFAY